MRRLEPGQTTYGMYYQDTPIGPDDQYQKDGTEVWDIYNTTGDVHPIHFHLFNVQILGRAKFAQKGGDGWDAGDPVGGNFEASGAWVAPDDNERGWKETVRMNPGDVTRVDHAVHAPARPDRAFRGKEQPHKVPQSPRTGGTSTSGTATSSSTKSTT